MTSMMFRVDTLYVLVCTQPHSGQGKDLNRSLFSAPEACTWHIEYVNKALVLFYNNPINFNLA